MAVASYHNNYFKYFSNYTAKSADFLVVPSYYKKVTYPVVLNMSG